ncbi:hypothetical protein EJ05DRAFT_474771 [Pseudovirgaria hyperparasitica]|uniref:Uncharacterized protein n=1 Tax=Pseudovirgaria hyperparasitica TaxID=470096 RepID=A0A6A6WA22_9PEZI|nr:uncharacterized protein EJ05DRAFT_474771 [Pseudovirgaria hyperparasitica]KAF2759708.1 hypothetical protein EJ05DRAFT_474771 [Pseudovirgaria hyperparasitica]
MSAFRIHAASPICLETSDIATTPTPPEQLPIAMESQVKAICCSVGSLGARCLSRGRAVRIRLGVLEGRISEGFSSVQCILVF